MATALEPEVIPLHHLLVWDPQAGTGMVKEGCCGYRFVARCLRCLRPHFQDEMQPAEGGYEAHACPETAPASGVEQVDPSELPALLAANALVLDVRDRSAWRAGHAPGAKPVPLDHLAERAHLVPQDQPVVLVSGGGARALAAARFLHARGLRNVRVLAGGQAAWERAGLAVEQG